MEFWVKLIEVTETRDQDARSDLNNNCTHVANGFWLFEGDEEALDDGLIFNVVSEQAIEGYGDMSGSQIKNMVAEIYNVDKCFLN